MGMYSFIMENNLNVSDELKEFSPRIGGETYDGEWLYSFLVEGEAIKFYGYWTAKYIKFLDMISQKGLVEGTMVVRYEDDSVPLIMCKFEKKGFNFRYANKPSWGDWERKTIVKPHIRKDKPVKAHTRKVK